MKTPIAIFIIFGILLSCKDDEVRTIDMRINHYKVTGNTMDPALVLQVQEGSEIGTNTWKNFVTNIEGFNYVPGYIYDLSVEVSKIDTPPMDGSSLRYILRKVKTTEAVDVNTQFDITLKINGTNYVTTDSGYKLLKQVDFDCNTLCGDLDNVLQNQDVVVGTFKRNQNKVLQLVSLK